MRVEQIVGRRIRDLRDSRGMTQDQLGTAVGELLGKKWSRQAVSAAEAGNRAFTAVELVAIARSLHVYVGLLFSPSLHVSESEIELGPGVVLDSQKVMEALFEGLDVSESREALKALIESARVISERSGNIDANARYLLESLTGLKASSGPARQPIVAAIVTSAEGVLITKRQDGKPPWGFVTGEVEPGERAEDAAVRECKEEAGLLVQVGQIIGERDHPQSGRHMIYMGAAPTHGTAVHVGDEAELAEVRWVSLTEAEELLPGMYRPAREYLARVLGGDAQ